MYEDLMLGLAFVAIYLQYRAGKSETEANRIFFNLVSLFCALILVAAMVNVAQAYGTQIYNIVNAVYYVMIFVIITELALLFLYMFFSPLLPKKWRNKVGF